MRAGVLLVVFALASLSCATAVRLQITCDFCVVAFEAAEAFAESKNVSQVVASFDGACHKLFHRSASLLKDCLLVAEKAGEVLAFLPDYAGDNYYPPPVACAMLLNVCKLPCCSTSHAPEQMYATFGRSSSELRITWVTLDNSSSVVQWGPSADRLTQSSQGFTTTYTDGGWVGTIHHVYLPNVAPGVPFFYRAGDGANFSAVASLVNPVRGYPLALASVGDLGTGPRGVPTMAHFEKLIATGQIGWVLHSGDISYSDGNQVSMLQTGKAFSVLARFNRNPKGNLGLVRPRDYLCQQGALRGAARQPRDLLQLFLLSPPLPHVICAGRAGRQSLLGL